MREKCFCGSDIFSKFTGHWHTLVRFENGGNCHLHLSHEVINCQLNLRGRLQTNCFYFVTFCKRGKANTISWRTSCCVVFTAI